MRILEGDAVDAFREVRMQAGAQSIQLPETLAAEIKSELERRGHREWSEGVLTLLDEAIRMSRVPGIVFVSAWNGQRRAALAFGLEIWEIIAFWKAREENWEVFRRELEEFSEEQLRAALDYYALYPAEIDARLEREAYWTPERVAAVFPPRQRIVAPPEPA